VLDPVAFHKLVQRVAPSIRSPTLFVTTPVIVPTGGDCSFGDGEVWAATNETRRRRVARAEGMSRPKYARYPDAASLYHCSSKKLNSFWPPGGLIEVWDRA